MSRVIRAEEHSTSPLSQSEPQRAHRRRTRLEPAHHAPRHRPQPMGVSSPRFERVSDYGRAAERRYRDAYEPVVVRPDVRMPWDRYSAYRRDDRRDAGDWSPGYDDVYSPRREVVSTRRELAVRESVPTFDVTKAEPPVELKLSRQIRKVAELEARSRKCGRKAGAALGKAAMAGATAAVALFLIPVVGKVVAIVAGAFGGVKLIEAGYWGIRKLVLHFQIKRAKREEAQTEEEGVALRGGKEGVATLQALLAAKKKHGKGKA